MLIQKGQLKRYRKPIKSGSAISASQTLQEAIELQQSIFKNLPIQLQYGLDFCAEIGDYVTIHKSRFSVPGTNIKKEDFLVQLVEILRIHHEQILEHVNEEGGVLNVAKHDWYNWIEKARRLRGLTKSEGTVLRDLPEG